MRNDLPAIQGLSDPEAVHVLADRIEDLRSEISKMGQVRAALVLAAVEADGQRGAIKRIAEEYELSENTVNRLVHEARKARAAEAEAR